MPIEEKPGAEPLDPKKKNQPYEDNRFAPHPEQMKEAARAQEKSKEKAR